MSEERYEIKEKLGQGGVGAVYKAFDTQLNREVAIKRVLADGGYDDQEEATKHLLKEATALSSVQHPHIVTVYDAGVDADGPYVVMELIDGKTLDQMVDRGTLTWSDLREIALQSQEALIAAQDLNLVHRDLKPSNVMVCWLPSGKFQVKIVDFGLAKFSATPSLQTIDHGDAVFGSIFFMAPEQFERTPLDKCTDMYAMGCLYYYSLTGEFPFSGETAASVMASHLQHHVTPLHELRPDIPRWGADWVMWHIERDMNARPQDARAALERFLFLDKQTTQAVNLTSTQATLVTPATGPQPGAPGVTSQTAPQLITPPQDGTGKVTPHTQTQQIVAQATAAQAVSQQPATVNTMGQTAPPQQSGGLSKNSRLAIIGILTLLVIVVSIIAVSVLGKQKETKDINDVMTEAKALNDKGKLKDGIKVNEEQLQGLLNRATNIESNGQRELILKSLAYAQADGSFDVGGKIIEHTANASCPENIRTEIFKRVMTKRQAASNIKPLLDYAKNASKEEKAAAAAIEAAHKSAIGQPAGDFIKDFLGLIKDSPSKIIRAAAERAVTDIISKSSDKTPFSTPIAEAYEDTFTDDAKYAMLRLSGSIGGSQNAQLIKKALNSDDNSLQNAAITALGQWSDTSEVDSLISFIGESSNQNLRKRAFDSAYALLQRNKSSTGLDVFWGNLASESLSQRQQLKIIGAMANQNHAWAMNILDDFASNSDKKVAEQAQKAKDKLQRRLRTR